jgi:hypothetical protein
VTRRPWSRRDQAALALLGALCLPDAMTSATFYWGLPYAVIPLAMSATVLVAVALARLVPAAWAAGAWLLAAALLLPPIEPWFARAKGLALCLMVLWLLPRIGPRLERPGHGRGAIPAGVAVAAAEWETASR